MADGKKKAELPKTEGRSLGQWLQEHFGKSAEEQNEDKYLHKAADSGDLDTLRTLLQKEGYKMLINSKMIWPRGSQRSTPLFLAAMRGHSSCVELLISQGAEVDLMDVKGQTALSMAVFNGHLDCVKVLLKAGADPNGKPLFQAAQSGRVDILRELIRSNADVDFSYQLEQRSMFPVRPLETLFVCPLFISAAHRHFPCFQMLLNAGANPNYNYNGRVNRGALIRSQVSCMLDAVLKLGCNPAFVRLLLDHGADPYLVSWENFYPKTMILSKVNTEALQVFQEAKRNPRRLMHLCRITIRKTMGKQRLQSISSLQLPKIIKRFMLHKD